MCLCVCSAGSREETGHLQPGADVCVCVCVQLALEKKQGISNLELMCEELQQEERAKELRREHKRQKRRKKKNKLKHGADDPDKENCMVRLRWSRLTSGDT